MDNSTLIVDKIINLTNEQMWTYGTSGKLFELSRMNIEQVLDPNYKSGIGVYYVVNPDDEPRLLNDTRYADKIAKPRPIGKARDGERLYRFIDMRGTLIAPITDSTGLRGGRINGNIYSDNEYIKLNMHHRYPSYISTYV